jgi:hypothetical protein
MHVARGPRRMITDGEESGTTCCSRIFVRGAGNQTRRTQFCKLEKAALRRLSNLSGSSNNSIGIIWRSREPLLEPRFTVSPSQSDRDPKPEPPNISVTKPFHQQYDWSRHPYGTKGSSSMRIVTNVFDTASHKTRDSDRTRADSSSASAAIAVVNGASLPGAWNAYTQQTKRRSH